MVPPLLALNSFNIPFPLFYLYPPFLSSPGPFDHSDALLVAFACVLMKVLMC